MSVPAAIMGLKMSVKHLASSRETMVRCCCALVRYKPLAPCMVTAIDVLTFSASKTPSFEDPLFYVRQPTFKNIYDGHWMRTDGASVDV